MIIDTMTKTEVMLSLLKKFKEETVPLKLNEICAGIAESAKEKNPMDLEAIIKMYEEESKKNRY
jgi:hypothetical protein